VRAPRQVWHDLNYAPALEGSQEAFPPKVRSSRTDLNAANAGDADW
jgi:hypothetical protein